MGKEKETRPTIVGWKEYIGLPSWKIKRLKAKMDTGARTSAIHASRIKKISTKKWELTLHPHRKKSKKIYNVIVPIKGFKNVTDSGGHRERRAVVETWIVLGKKRKKIELTVTNRKNMLFRLILGRRALAKGFCVDPSQKYLVSRKKYL